MDDSGEVRIRKTGISFWILLGIVFIILKLTNVIAWSWLWVLAPFWIGIALIVVFIVIILLIVGVMVLLEKGTR